MHTFKLPGQQVAQPPLQQRGDAPHEEQPDSPARSPEATAWTFTHWTLEGGRENINYTLNPSLTVPKQLVF